MGFEWSRREAMLLAGAAALVGGAPSLQAQTGARSTLPFETEALAWLRRNAKPLEGFNPTPASLQPLVRALEGAQVIGLGEATHGSHEDQVAKAAIVRALIAHGDVRVIALEGNRRPGGQLNDYVRGGGPDPIATLREANFFQAWQSEEFLNLISWIRAWNLSGKPAVRIIGIDAQSLGSEAYQTYSYFQSIAPRHSAQFERPLAPLIGSSEARQRTAAEAAALLSRSQWEAARQALAQIRSIIMASTRPGAEEAARAATSALQAMNVEGERSGSGSSSLRERLMADNLMDQSGGERTILWAHNLHVANPAGGTVSTGGHLRRRLGRRYRTVAFEYERGAIRTKAAAGTPQADRVPWQTSERAPVAGGLGPLLGAVGPDQFWVDLSPASDPPPPAMLGHAFAHDWPEVASPGGSGATLPLANQVDLLVFLRRLTPSRLLPFVPQA